MEYEELIEKFGNTCMTCGAFPKDKLEPHEVDGEVVSIHCEVHPGGKIPDEPMPEEKEHVDGPLNKPAVMPDPQGEMSRKDKAKMRMEQELDVPKPKPKRKAKKEEVVLDETEPPVEVNIES